MRYSNLFTILLIGLIGACTDQKPQLPAENPDTSVQETAVMQSYVAIFEIPATDISRAIQFYEAILTVKIETYELPEMELGVLPYENQQVTGVIVKGEGYTPSSKGVSIYLNGGQDLQVMLDRVEENGGKVVVPKTPHADGNGYFALFLDTEGNKLGLHSPE